MYDGHPRGHGCDGRDRSAKGHVRRPSGTVVADAVSESDHLNLCFVTVQWHLRVMGER
jgi:hypothetical protein